MHDPDEEAIEEERVGEAADAVEQQRERQVGRAKAEDEKQDVEDQPPDDADEHDAAGRKDVGKDAGEPTGNRGGCAVDGEDKRGVAGGEAKVDEVFREEGLLDAVAGHAEDDGDVAAEQRERHAQEMTIWIGLRRAPRLEVGGAHAMDSSTTIWSLMSAGRLSAARSKAAMLWSNEKFAEMSGLRSTLPEASRATALG